MKTKETEGVTLLALVITIVVLMILAGVSINVTLGDNGIIKKVQNSANLTRESEAKEIIQRIVMEFYLTNDYETLKDFLNDKVLKGKIDKVEENTDGTLNVWKDNYSVTVDNKTNSSSSNGNGNDNSKAIKIDAIPYEGKYDGNEHEAISSVTVEPKDAKIEYSTDGTNYSTTIPRIINAGTATINIRASKENYETKNVTVIAKIEKAEGKLTLSATSGISTNGDNLTFTVSGNTGTLSVVSSDTNIATVSISGSTVTVKPGTTVGTAAITVTSAATTNYNMKSATYIATIKPKFNVSSGVGYYADVDDDGIVDGVIFGDFKEGGSGKWGSVPFYPELSSYSIPTTSSTKNYYVSQSNYDGVFGSKPVLSTKDSGNSRFWVMSLNDLSSSTYSRSYATDFSRNGWKIPSKTQWLAFAAKMGVTKENYGQLGLKSEYWTSTLDKRDDPDNPNTYTIDFTQAYIRSWFMADKYIRLATTF